MFYVDDATGMLCDIATNNNGQSFGAGDLQTKRVIPSPTASLTATSDRQSPAVSVFLIDIADPGHITEAIWNNGWNVNFF